MKFMSMMMENAEVMRVVQRFCMYNAKKAKRLIHICWKQLGKKKCSFSRK